MPMYAVIGKLMKEGFTSSNVSNPTESELLRNLESYTQVYLFHSFEDAQKVSELFFRPHRPPKSSGRYGLIAKVAVEFSEIPTATQVDTAVVRNDLAAHWSSREFKEENTGVHCSCTIVSPNQIKSISEMFIPRAAKASNPNLQDINFREQAASYQCSMM